MKTISVSRMMIIRELSYCNMIEQVGITATKKGVLAEINNIVDRSLYWNCFDEMESFQYRNIPTDTSILTGIAVGAPSKPSNFLNPDKFAPMFFSSKYYLTVVEHPVFTYFSVRGEDGLTRIYRIFDSEKLAKWQEELLTNKNK